jgi:hypothetical protein
MCKDVFWSGDFGGMRLTHTFLMHYKSLLSLSDSINSIPELQDFMDMQDNVKLYFKICNNIMQPTTKSFGVSLDITARIVCVRMSSGQVTLVF